MKSAFIVSMAAVAAALPGLPHLNDAQKEIFKVAKRQADTAAQAGLTPADIANFALTLEWLEANFYQDCVASLGAAAFQAAGLQQAQVDTIVKVGQTEFEHASFLQGFIARAGAQPVQECVYNFPCSSVQEMVTVAGILENVGISAYAGAAAAITDATVLTAAATILSIEARHQTLIRTLAGQVAIPQAFDATLTPKQVFTLAAPFVVSCPAGSNLAITPNPTLTQVSPAAGQPVAINQRVQFSADTLAQATNCAFKSGGLANGVVFTQLDPATGACTVPQNLAGISYVMLTNAAPLDGNLAEENVLAGPAVLSIS